MTRYPHYIGNGPYCFTNSLVMALGGELAPSLVETLTGSPFGFQLLAGELPLFDPLGWDPEQGLDQAIGLLGVEPQRRTHPDAAAALAGLQSALGEGRVLVGPVDMGLLRHQPGSDRATGADHYVLALAADAERVVFHDPQAHPYAALPTAVFLEAWRAEAIDYLDGAYILRTGFRGSPGGAAEVALTRLLPLARAWAAGRNLPVPPGTLGGADGYRALAETAADPSPDLAGLLAEFSLRAGARRRGDAAHWLARIGEDAAADVLERQAVVLGGLQHAAVTRDGSWLSDGFRTLADLHDELVDALG